MTFKFLRLVDMDDIAPLLSAIAWTIAKNEAASGLLKLFTLRSTEYKISPTEETKKEGSKRSARDYAIYGTE
jgi:hypothetical protein